MKLFLVVVYLITGGWSAAGPKAPEVAEAKCITPEIVDGVEEKWVDDFSRSPGLYNTISYQFVDWRGTMEYPPAPPVDKNAKHKRCYKVYMKTLSGPFEEFKSTCTYYNDVARQNCKLETKGTSMAGQFRHYGGFQIVMTDQQSYMVVYGCLMGAKNYFMVLTRTATIPEATRNKIEDYLLNKLKFDKSYMNYNGSAEVGIQKLEMVDCAGAPAGGYPSWPSVNWPQWPKAGGW